MTTKILIVDDSAADRTLFARMLPPHVGVLQAADVAAGLALYEREQPECVLLDHHMPGVLGLDGLTEFVRANAAVIMLTGAGSEELATEAFKRGARDFVRKDGLTGAALTRIVMRERERRRLELALQATQQRFDEVAARIGDVLWVRALDGNFLYLSPAFEQVWGRPAATMTAEVWDSCLHPEDRAVARQAESHKQAGAEYDLEFRIVKPDGNVRRIRSRGYPIFEGGRVARFGGIAHDVTEETRIQQELRLAQKLEAIGQLAAGVAHEINTPAQYVSDNVSFLTESIQGVLPLLAACTKLAQSAASPSAAELTELKGLATAVDLAYLTTELPSTLQQTAAGLGQIKKIVQAMKEFSHPADEMQVVDLNRAVETTVTVTKNEWKYVADVSLKLAPDLPTVECYPSEINQVLLNLIVNAAHAIGDTAAALDCAKGEITIATRALGNRVRLTVADTGCGIPEAIRDKIYNPFFTTKSLGKGTGQGLAIAHRIVVEHHGGTISFESTLGRGTTFAIELPVHAERRRQTG